MLGGSIYLYKYWYQTTLLIFTSINVVIHLCTYLSFKHVQKVSKTHSNLQTTDRIELANATYTLALFSEYTIQAPISTSPTLTNLHQHSQPSCSTLPTPKPNFSYVIAGQNLQNAPNLPTCCTVFYCQLFIWQPCHCATPALPHQPYHPPHLSTSNSPSHLCLQPYHHHHSSPTFHYHSTAHPHHHPSSSATLPPYSSSTLAATWLPVATQKLLQT